MKAVFFTGLIAVSLESMASLLPIAPSGPLREFALARNWDLRDEFGWNEVVQAIARVRDSLPADQAATAGILVINYGDAGAVEILGPAYRLPAPISSMNSWWLRGYPQPTPSTLILVGYSWDRADSMLTGCRAAGKLTPSDRARNDEFLQRPDIFVCGPPRLPWPEFWKKMRSFG